MLEEGVLDVDDNPGCCVIQKAPKNTLFIVYIPESYISYIVALA
jgi:hypothetical protein